MNKQECKKYIKRAFKELEKQKNNITLEDFKLEIMKQISKTAIYMYQVQCLHFIQY